MVKETVHTCSMRESRNKRDKNYDDRSVYRDPRYPLSENTVIFITGILNHFAKFLIIIFTHGDLSHLEAFDRDEQAQATLSHTQQVRCVVDTVRANPAE